MRDLRISEGLRIRMLSPLIFDLRFTRRWNSSTGGFRNEPPLEDPIPTTFFSLFDFRLLRRALRPRSNRLAINSLWQQVSTTSSVVCVCVFCVCVCVYFILLQSLKKAFREATWKTNTSLLDCRQAKTSRAVPALNDLDATSP